MFDNIGSKIKGLATVICWIGIIISIIIGFMTFAQFNRLAPGRGVLMAILIIAGGSLLSWIGSFVLYGFGELIDKADSIDRKLGSGSGPSLIGGGAASYPGPVTNRQPGPNEWKCKCGRINPNYVGTCSCGLARNGGAAMVKPAPTFRTVYCPECGSQERADHKNCYKCGAKLS